MGVLIVTLSAVLRSLPKDFTGMLLVVMLFGAGAPTWEPWWMRPALFLREHSSVLF
jgi:hypothetical protein